MPVLDGMGTLRAIRADPRSRTLPVILVTGSHGESDRVQGLGGGADDFLAKPVAVRELAARVRAQIRAKVAWTRELERGREHRRRLAVALEGLALQPAYVKLDIEWVKGIDRDPVRRALVSGLVYFATETGCELIAEGVETRAELESLRDLGVQLGQGYLLGRPKPAADSGTPPAG